MLYLPIIITRHTSFHRPSKNFSFRLFSERPSSLAVELEHVVVELEQCCPVRDRQQRDPSRFGTRVQCGLYIDADCACALVQNGEFRLVVEQSGHGDALFLPA